MWFSRDLGREVIGGNLSYIEGYSWNNSYFTVVGKS